MGDVVNLNRFRKARARVEREQKAMENRQKFGRTKAEKDCDARLKEQASRHLDGHRFDDPT